MLYYYVSVAYTVTNLVLALTVYLKARRNLIHQFYFFCVLCLVCFGILSYLQLEWRLSLGFINKTTLFLYSLIPFFFLHFVVLFLRRYDILRSRLLIFMIYFAGLFCYVMVLRGLIPTPFTAVKEFPISGYIYYITWMSIFFGIGIAILFSLLEGFSNRSGKSNLLLTGFAFLMLVLPSPFTESMYYLIFQRNTEVYGITSALSLLIAIYLIFRHKIVITLYDAVRNSLGVLNDVFIFTNEDFHIQMLHGAVGLLGYTEWELYGKPLGNMIAEKHFIENYLNYVKSGKMRECLFDTEVIRKDGTRLIMDFSFSPVYENETIAGFVGIARDVTKRKTMEIALRASEERFRRLAEQAPDIIYHYRLLPDPSFEYVSPAAVAITHYSPEEFYARPDLFVEIVHPDDRPIVEQYFRGEGIFGQAFTLRLMTKDGRVIWTEQRVVPVYDEQGYRIAIEGIIRDITERKELEDQLRQAQKFESIGILAGGIAHDFNNILAIILGYTTAMRDILNDPVKLEKHMGKIDMAIKRGTGFVRELLMMARKSETQFTPVNVNQLLADIVRLLGETFPKSIDLTLKLTREPAVIHADTSQLHQAFLNLCVNARDAMPDGGTLSLRTEIIARESLLGRFPDVSAAQYLNISVSDTGTGMPEAIREHIFEPFFTTKEPGKGTGLGLAVVYGIVKSHGGFITVESELNAGTVFNIYLPIPLHPAAAETSAVQQSAATGGAPETGTILLVEDEEMLLELMQQLLEGKGYRVLSARDGQDAAALFKQHGDGIDIIVTDMGLPKMGGWELAKSLLKQKPSLHVIYTSGYFEPEIQTEMVKHGARHFIQKPYSPLELMEKIQLAKRETVATA